LTISNRVVTAPGDATLLNGLADALESQFNSNIASVGSQEAFLSQVGNANAVSTRSFLSPGVLPADQTFFLNYGVAGGLSLGEGASLSQGITTPSNQLPPIGVSGKSGLSLGISAKKLPRLLPLDPARVMYTASFYSNNLSSLIGNGITLKSMQAALGVSYQYYPAQSWTPMIRFNGFKISSGLSLSTLDVAYTTPFQLTQGTAPTAMDWNSTVNIAVNSSVWSLTHEVTTGVRLLWVWNLYTGLGLDFNVGSSDLTGSSSGPVTAPNFSGTAVVSGDPESAAPSWIQVRALVGTQIDLGVVGIYAQGTISTPSSYGLNFGAHFVL